MRLDEITFSSTDDIGPYLDYINEVLKLSKMSIIKPSNHNQFIDDCKNTLLIPENREKIDFWVIQSIDNDILYRSVKRHLGL